MMLAEMAGFISEDLDREDASVACRNPLQVATRNILGDQDGTHHHCNQL